MRTIAHPASLLCCLQRVATQIFTFFKEDVDKHLGKEAEDQIDTSGMSTEVKKAAMDGFKKKHIGDLWDHVALNDNTQCASIDWDSDWEAPDWVNSVWDNM